MAGEITPGMEFGTLASKTAEMTANAKKMGNKLKKDGGMIIAFDETSGKRTASMFARDRDGDGKIDFMQYEDNEGRIYIGNNSGERFTTIYSQDEVFAAHDTNPNNKVDAHEIQFNLDTNYGFDFDFLKGTPAY